MEKGPLHIDLETRSAADLKKVGSHRYAEDPSTSIILASYRFGQGPVLNWTGEIPPADVLDAISQHHSMVGHNQQFERVVLNARLKLNIQPESQDCTMARAAAMGLPSSLDNLGKALKLGFQKDKIGHALMLRMCKPKTHEPLTWHEDPKDVERLGAYCDRDVETECDADDHLPRLSERERRVWNLDQRINDRGFAVDLRLVQRADACVAEAKRRADREMWRLTNGAIDKVSKAAKIADWINAAGIPCTSIADGGIDELIVGSDLVDREDVAAVLRLRRASAGAFKFEAMLRAVCSDGRIRGSLAYHGTHGGRWAGRVVQPQNFKRMDTDEEIAQVGVALDLLRSFEKPAEFLDACEAVLDLPTLEVLSLCARPMIVAKPDHILRDADFSNIEGRLNAWFAGEDWKAEAFRAFDRGEGADLYRVTAASILNKPVEQVTKSDRQHQGKTSELACGYQGGPRALQKKAAELNIIMSDVQARMIVTGWRNANNKIVDSWEEYGQAAIDAVRAPGMIVPVLRDKVRYVSNGDFLFCRLPSGRVISYAAPSVGWKTKVITIDDEQVELNNYGLSYWGQKNGRWLHLDLYGGAQCAHIVSGTARDLLVEAMFAVEAAGHTTVLTVHDEILAEDPEGFRSLEEFKATITASQPRWAEGLPLVASAWEDVRYVK